MVRGKCAPLVFEFVGGLETLDHVCLLCRRYIQCVNVHACTTRAWSVFCASAVANWNCSETCPRGIVGCDDIPDALLLLKWQPVLYPLTRGSALLFVYGLFRRSLTADRFPAFLMGSSILPWKILNAVSKVSTVLNLLLIASLLNLINMQMYICRTINFNVRICPIYHTPLKEGKKEKKKKSK